MVRIEKDHLIILAIIAIVVIGSVALSVGYIARDIVKSQRVVLQQNFEDLRDNSQNSHDSLPNLGDDLSSENLFTIENSLISYYDNVREYAGPTGSKYWQGSTHYWQNAANFAAKLGLHNLGKYYWPEVEDSYFNSVGEYSYDVAKEKVEDVIELIDIHRNDTTLEKIEIILEFITEYIEYYSDKDDKFYAPIETISYRSGDCDDFSILAATLFEAVGIDAAIGLFEGEPSGAHAMVLVHLDHLPGYAYWYYSDLTSIGLNAGRWIIVEPQTTMSELDTDWITYWNIVVAAPL